MGQTITSGELIKKLGGELIGDSNILINSVASLESAHQKSISFFNNPRYADLLKTTKSAVVIVDRESLSFRKGASIVVDNPYLYFAKVSQLLNPTKPLKKKFINPQLFIQVANWVRIYTLAPMLSLMKMFLLMIV